MDLPCLKWQRHVKEKWAGLNMDLKKCFTSLQEIDDIFEFGLAQTTHEDVDFLLGISKYDNPFKKDPGEAAKSRERGNASFKAKDYITAALHYSQGLCNAAPSSEQLSLCYANRSAALFYLHRYQDCLWDIQRALDHGYPPQLHSKLQTRRTQCLDHLSGEAHQAGTHAASDHVPDVIPSDTKRNLDLNTAKLSSQNETKPMTSISSGVAVFLSAEKGRHLVATEEIAAGELVLRDTPYCCVLLSGMEALRGTELDRDREGGGGEGVFGMEDRRCHFCLGETLTPVPCEGCAYSRYCSDWCRTAAWEEHHCWECPIGAQLKWMGVMSHLALRVALKAGLNGVHKARKANTGKGSETQPITKERVIPKNYTSRVEDTSDNQEVNTFSRYHSDSYLSVYHLLPHVNDHSPSMRFLCTLTAATLHQVLSSSGPLPASWLLAGGCSDQSEGEESASWEPELTLLGGVVLRHMLQLLCNGQAVSAIEDTCVTDSAVQPSREVRIATAIFPTLSLLNHSCRPNTSISFGTGTKEDPVVPDPRCGSGPDASGSGLLRSCGVTVTVRAAKAIKPGEEILHCYGPHCSRMVWCERQRLLQEQYYFQCVCEACVDPMSEWEGSTVEGNQSELQCGKCEKPLTTCIEEDFEGFVCPSPYCGKRVSLTQVKSRLEEVEGYLKEAMELLEIDRPDQAQEVLERMSSRSAVILSDTHPLQGQVADACARAYATMGDWRKAAWHLERSMLAIATQYGETSAELGHQLFKLVQLHFNGGSPGPALVVLPRARQLLSLHYGPQCADLLELQAMEDCLQGAL